MPTAPAMTSLSRSRQCASSGRAAGCGRWRTARRLVPGITAMFTPGHTPGSCSYLLHQDSGEVWVLAGDAAKNRGELLTEEVQMSMDPPATQSSLRRIKAAGTRVLPGHDGWVTLKEGEVLAEGGNDKRLVFGQGITINGGNREMLLHMD